MEITPTGTKCEIAGLDCIVVDPAPAPFQPQTIAVLCHGFGAPGNDLVPLAPAMFQDRPAELAGVRFVFPAAPIQLDPSGYYDSRAWWPIDMERLQVMIERNEFRDLRNECHDLLPVRRASVTALVRAVADDAGIGLDRVVLGGFSQGSMVATDVALHLEQNLGGLLVWSGTLTNEAAWREQAPRHPGLTVVQTHGRSDPILPFGAAEWLRDLFEEFQMNYEFVPFVGEHQIPPSAMRAGIDLIAGVASTD